MARKCRMRKVIYDDLVMDHAANSFTTLMVVAARWAGCRGDHMVSGVMSVHGGVTQELRPKCCQGSLEKTRRQTNRLKQTVQIHVLMSFQGCDCLLFSFRQRCLYAYCKPENNGPAGHVSVTLNVTYCHVSILLHFPLAPGRYGWSSGPQKTGH